MLLAVALSLFATSSQQPHLPPSQVNDLAVILAHDEGWPLGNPDYTLDPMKSDTDDGFDSIGVYQKSHLVRMYSIDRSTGQVVDFMRGCQVFRFKDIEGFAHRIQAASHSVPLTDQQLAAKAGCPRLSLIDTRWVK